MTRERRKHQPLSRTILTQFSIDVADIHLRDRAMRGSIAKRVSEATQYVKGDAVVSGSSPLTLEGIETAIIIHGFEPFLVTITNNGQSITSPCHGLFVYYGALESVTITNPDPVRLTYVKS